MSLFEIFVISVVCLFVLKAEDFAMIVHKFREIQSFIANTKHDVLSQFDPISYSGKSMDGDQMLQMNFYLEKITNLGSKYEGEYSIIAVKNHYNQLVKNKIKEHKIDYNDEQTNS